MTISPQAQHYLTELLEPSEALTIGLSSGGCTGFQASLKRTPIPTTTELSIGDRVFIENEETQQILQGAELIMVKDAFSTSLHIKPPTNFYACGCGASFSPK